MDNAIKKTLWATADKLRSNMDAAEYKHHHPDLGANYIMANPYFNFVASWTAGGQNVV